jgi:hypothetical protein
MRPILLLRLHQEVGLSPLSESRTVLRPPMLHISIAVLDTTVPTTFGACPCVPEPLVHKQPHKSANL